MNLNSQFVGEKPIRLNLNLKQLCTESTIFAARRVDQAPNSIDVLSQRF